jgi:transcription antitermination factor NusG
MLASDAAPLEDYRRGGPSWFAIHTRHQHEKVAAHMLARKGFEVFLPLYSAVRNWSDRTRQVSLPLFPSYLFLRGGLDRRLSILTTPGVHCLVAFGGLPAVIPDAEMDAVRQILARSVRVEPTPFLKCGDWVRVKCGPLEGLEGILVRSKNQHRLVLSVELVQQSVAVEVDVWAVERVQRLERRWSARPFDSYPQAFCMRHA